MEKLSLHEALSTVKQKTTDFQQQEEKANKRLQYFEIYLF